MSTTTESLPRWDADVPLPAARSNRPTTRIHRVEARLARMLLGGLERTRIDKAARRMGWLLRHAGPWLRSVHRRGHANLSLIYPDMTKAEREQILRGVWENLGMTVAEFAHLDAIGDRVTVVNEDALTPFISGGKKAVFISGHFANWEAMAIALFERGVKYAVVYRAANNPIVDEEIIRRRSEAMSRRQIPKDKRGARSMLAALKDDLSLCMLTDQKLNDGISSPLLGYPAMTAPAAARLALKEGVPIIPLHIVRRPGSRFVLTVHDPLPVPKSGDLKTDTEILTAAMNEALGRFILERPDQWLWFHRRWPKKIAS